MASEEAKAAVRAAIAKRTVFEIEGELSRLERVISMWTDFGPRDLPPYHIITYTLFEMAELKEELLSKDG